MIMTEADAHRILDLRTQTVLTGELVLYKNEENVSYSEGNDPFVKQRVMFQNSDQIELGNTDRERNEGTLVFDIFCRSGTGSAASNALLNKIKVGFRGKRLDGVTLAGVNSLGESEAHNWLISTYLIPFYFYSI